MEQQIAIGCLILLCAYCTWELVQGALSIIRRYRTGSVYGIVTVPDDKFNRAEWEAIDLALEISEHQAHWTEQRQDALDEYAAGYHGKPEYRDVAKLLDEYNEFKGKLN